MSRLATIGDGANTHAGYKYLGAGRIVEEDYEDIEVRLDYAANNFAALDRFGRILDQIWTDYGANPDVVLDHYSYTYDRAGNRTSRANELHSAFDEDYTYDRLDRLTAADRADNFDQSWGLDGLGNFSAFDDDGSSQTRTANAANEISAITGGWITPGYDQAGNMISGPKPGSGTTRVHYVYDAWNRQVEVRADDSGEPGDLIAEYQYDGANRRVDKVVTLAGGGPSQAHYYFNAEWQLLEEQFVDGQGATVASNQYVWSARYIDSRVMRFHDGNGDGDCLDAADNIRYYAGDANFNVTATIDAGTGAVVERYVYTAYGQATVYDGSWANPTAPTTDSPLYCGYFFDTETSLYQVRNRYYDLGLSTFVSRDPVGHAAGDLNLYRYCGRNVITSVDPVGEFPISTEDECECKHTVIALFKTNKHIEEYSGKFGSTCPRPQFFCENCDDDPDMYGQYVPGDPATKQAKKIRLCYNTLRGEDETLMVDTIIHEMVHALQDCYAWKNPFGRCASCYRNEIEANYCEPNGSKDFDALLAASSGSCWNDCLGKKLSFDQKHALKVWFKKHKGELCKFPR